MIVSMKQATLLMSARERTDALKKLRELGVLHVQPVRPPLSETLDDLKQRHSRLEHALAALDGFEPAAQKSSGKTGESLVLAILENRRKKASFETMLREKKETLAWFELWGDVSPAAVRVLKEAGVFVRLCVADKAEFKSIPDDLNIQVLGETGGLVRLALFAESEEQAPDLKSVRIPDVEPNDLRSGIREMKSEIGKLETELVDFAAYGDQLKNEQSRIARDIELNRVLAGMGDEDDFIYLQGFCPVDAVDSLKQACETEGWGYVLQEPENPEIVPTLLKNNRISRIVEPLFHFMGTLPGYHEVDVSFVFLLFFSLFYAMIIGDAGYGLVFLGATAFFRAKNKKAPYEPFALFYVLSVATIVWGALTGNWFGSRAIAAWGPARNLVIEPMFSFSDSKETTRFMMRFSFFLGLIQLIAAHSLAFRKKLPSLRAVAELGWILICVAMFFLVDLMVLSNPLPKFAVGLAVAGLCIAGMFTNFQKNPLKMIGSFLATILNSIQDVISAFSDIVSYIRLFAVGLAGVTVAASFNDMAGGIFAPIILLLGHGLNIVLGMMSVMVHGVRLNMLEFSGHLGQEWTGRPYEPFRKS